MRYHVNGELVPDDEATVSVRDRGFAYGDAAFETLRAYGGTIFEWDAHADRLANTCEVLGIDHGLSGEELRRRVRETLAANDLTEAYVRLSITRGVQPGKLSADPEVDPGVVIVVADLPRGGRTGSSVWDGPATVEIADVQRVPDAAIPAAAKTHNYLDGILARMDAPEADEAIMLDADGAIAEGATSNVFFVDGGRLHTPTLDGPVLPGVTRRVVLDLAEESGVPAERGRYAPDDLRAADEAFLTNTTWELRPIERFDGERIGGGPVTERLSTAFDGLVEERHYES